MASSDATRLLVLGVARMFEPANGYQLRRELLSWGVESWAHINPGSIYSMLTTLTKQELLERVDLVAEPGARPVAVYRSTPAGGAELLELIRQGLTEVQAFDRTAFYAAMSLMVSFFTRAEVIVLLEERHRNIDAAIERNHEQVAQLDPRNAPPHVARMFGYSDAFDRAEADWVLGFIEATRAGEMLFADDDWADKYEPAADDPGWRMVAERAAYLDKLKAEGAS